MATEYDEGIDALVFDACQGRMVGQQKRAKEIAAKPATRIKGADIEIDDTLIHSAGV